MKKLTTRFSKWQLAAMVSMPLIIMLSPLTVQLFLDFILDIFTAIWLAAVVYFVVFCLIKILTPEKINTKPKGKKKTPAYLET